MSFASDAAVAFAMHADTSGLSYEQGVRLAEAIAGEVEQAAEDRKYIPGIVIEHPEEETDEL